MDLITITIGIIFGFILAMLLAGKKLGHKGLISSLIHFTTKKYHVHIHYWILSIIAILALAFLGYYHAIIYGVLLGIMLQGLSYKDFYQVFHRKH